MYQNVPPMRTVNDISELYTCLMFLENILFKKMYGLYLLAKFAGYRHLGVATPNTSFKGLGNFYDFDGASKRNKEEEIVG